MLIAIVVISIILLALIGVPLFIIMALAALISFSFAGIQTSAVAIEIFKMANIPTLVSLPLFTLAGFMLAESHSPQRLLRFAKAAFGHLPGGTAIVGLIVCAFFTAFTGASGVTIIAMGGLLYPILREPKFSDNFSLGLLTTCGSLGLLFPPSLPLIIYGVVGKVDIGDLFKAGILPGIVLIVVFSLWSMIKGKPAATQKFSWEELRLSFKSCIWELILPLVVLIGIYGGFITISEMATLTTLYVAIMEFVIYRDLKLKNFTPIVLDSMYLLGSILLILCCALGFTNFLVDAEVPMKVLAVMKVYLHNRYTFLLFLNIFLLVIGALKDVFSAIIVVVPLILPIAKDFGIHPVHLAIIFLTNLEIGYIAPPFGINLFIGSARFNKPITQMYRASIPFLILSFIALMIITYVPFLSLAFLK